MLKERVEDALNKVRFESLTRQDVEDKDAELRIDIAFNESRNSLIIEDSGVGIEIFKRRYIAIYRQ